MLPAVPQGKAPSDIARRRMTRRAAGGRRSDDRWAAVLTAASAVFRDIGYQKATLEDIAREVGINRATLYYYVGTKEELLVALLAAPISAVTARLAEDAAHDGPARDKLAAALRGYVETLDQHPELFIFLRENVHAAMTGPDAEALVAEADRYGRVLTQIIREGAASGEFRSDVDPQVAVLGILGMFNWMHRWYRPDGPRSIVEIGEELVRMSLAAVEAP
jgi:TetR/AcrR family transcriptional regulator, cholesterol catabolism regulator